MSEFLSSFLPKVKSGKKQKFMLGVSETKLGPQITESCGYTCSINPAITEMNRGIRTHFSKFSKKLDAKTLKQAQLGLAHSFSRVKVSHDVNREDKPIIQAIAIIDSMDKNINLFAMRLKEWFGYHFPELAKIVTDNSTYAKVVHLVENKDNISSDMLEQLEEVCLDEDKAKQIVEAAKTSMGHDLNEGDVTQIKTFCARLVDQIDYKEQLSGYLENRLKAVSPNLQALVGDNVCAKLISQAGSLVNLSKAAASTIQILGAEKALFRALKAGGNTPKYGILYNSTFIGRAGQKNKGRISRYLANKCAIAARFDQFAEQPTDKIGKRLHE